MQAWVMFLSNRSAPSHPDPPFTGKGTYGLKIISPPPLWGWIKVGGELLLFNEFFISPLEQAGFLNLWQRERPRPVNPASGPARCSPALHR